MAKSISFDPAAFIAENMDLLQGIIEGLVSTIHIVDKNTMGQEDLVQEGWLAILSKCEYYEQEKGGFLDWAAVVVRNRLLDIARKDVRVRRSETHLKPIEDCLDSLFVDRQLNDLTETYVSVDLQNAIKAVAEEEPSKTVQIGLAGIWNAFTGEKTKEELAEYYGVSIYVFNASVCRARQKIKPYLKSYGKKR